MNFIKRAALAIAITIFGAMQADATVTIPSGATVICEGDSQCLGSAGGVTCTAYFTVTTAPTTKTCAFDVFVSNYPGAKILNFSVAGSCANAAVVTGTNAYTSSADSCLSTNTNSLLQRYNNDTGGYLSSSTYYVIWIGTNDAGNGALYFDGALSLANYQNTIDTVLYTLTVTKSQAASHFILVSIPPRTNPGNVQPFAARINTQLQAENFFLLQEAARYGMYYADAYTAINNCGQYVCLFTDGLHPNPTGAAVIANVMANATIPNWLPYW